MHQQLFINFQHKITAEKYPIISLRNHTAFEFLSEGPNGTIKKVVCYQKVSRNIFNLAFGDRDEGSQALLDFARSNNDDKDKIPATVAFTILSSWKIIPVQSSLLRGLLPHEQDFTKWLLSPTGLKSAFYFQSEA